MNDNDREVAVFLIDTNPVEWMKFNGPKDLTSRDFLDQFFGYLNQMILSNILQLSPIVAYNQYGAKWIYPTPDITSEIISGKRQATNPDDVNNYFRLIVNNLADYANECAGKEVKQGVRLDAALSLALCHLNHYDAKYKRIVVLTVSEDPVGRFEPTMNTIFAAHRIEVVIDSILIKVEKSLFLNQAAIFTKGFSIALKHRPRFLMQYLLTIPPLLVRKHVQINKVQSIDYQTPAINTKNLIDCGLMCPICLSVFEKTDKSLAWCTVCGSRAQISTKL